MMAETGTLPLGKPAEAKPDGDPPLAPGLYLVATPIGNLEDITLRALRVLRSADRIACEDTRQTQKLLNHFGIRKPTVSYHLHNEESRATSLVAALQAGERLALVSDAGTPGIADPGHTLVRQAIEAGVPVFPIPGANAAINALVASGFPTERFVFHGFLPAKEGQRRSFLERLLAGLQLLADQPATQIFYEAPHRLLATLSDFEVVFGPNQPLAIARELTKLHEEMLRGSVSALVAELAARPVVRGELVLLLDAEAAAASSSGGAGAPSLAEAVHALVREGLAEKDALKQVAKARGLGKSEAYREWQRSRKAHG